ncbi:MAG: hypothetical protein ACTSYI_06620 [Promethearchaeota archaeon]
MKDDFFTHKISQKYLYVSSIGLLMIIGGAIFGIVIGSFKSYLNLYHFISIIGLPGIFIGLNLLFYQKTANLIFIKILAIIEIVFSIFLLFLMVDILTILSNVDEIEDNFIANFLMGFGMILSLGANIRSALVMNIPSKLEKLISNMKEKERQKLSSISDISNSKTILYGMIKLDKKIDVNEASKRLNISVIEIKNLIYHLVGEGKMDGEFQGDLFIFSSDVDVFIENLDNNFENWNQKEKISAGKI